MPSHEAVAELVDLAVVLPGGHGAAELVGLARREAGADGRDLHRLFLEQRNAVGALEDSLRACRWGRRHLLEPETALEVGMNHAALDRSGTNDRDLDDEIVELLRPEPRQHRHLRAALDLEDAERVGAMGHLVDPRARPIVPGQGRGQILALLIENAGERQVHAVVDVHHLEGAADAGQHAEREDVDLEDFEGVDVVLVPLDDGAILHRRIRDGDEEIELVAGDDEAADVLAQVTRKAHELAGDLDGLAQGRLVGIEAELFHRARARGRASTSPSSCRSWLRSCRSRGRRPLRPRAARPCER